MSTSTDVTLAWLQRARSDLQLGRAALHTQGVMPEDAAFHAQQCAEKALKALLLHREISFPKTHATEEQHSSAPLPMLRPYKASPWRRGDTRF